MNRKTRPGASTALRRRRALEGYLAGPLVAAMKSLPAFRDVTVKQFDVMEGLTAVTRGPVG